MPVRFSEIQVCRLERDRVRYVCGPFLEHAVDRGVARVIRSRIVPGDQDPFTLVLTEHGQLRKSAIRIGCDRRDQVVEMADHSFNGLGVEQIGIVLPGARQSTARLDQGQGHVEHGCHVFSFDMDQLQTR